MALSWHAKRLARMNPLEIVHRIGEQVKRQISRRKDYGWAAFAAPTVIPQWPVFKEALRAGANEPLRVAVRRSADRILSGEFAALGVAWPRRDPGNLFPAELWRLDPVSGLSWPGADRFCFEIPYRHERERGDIKYVWEVNRLQFLQPLSAAYALFDDKAALAAVDAAIVGWAAANPPFLGLAWNSGIELALRAVSVLIAVSLCGEALSEEAKWAAPALLCAHLYWIQRFPSRFSSANNHRVAELMGSFLIAELVPGLPDGTVIAKRARDGLAREASRQFHADGTPAEQSPTYGAFTAEMLLLCAFFARRTGRPLDQSLDERLAHFADFIAAIADPSGRTPAIGDDDEGRVLTLCDVPESRYPASVARAVASYRGVATAIAPLAAELRDAVFGAPAAAAPPVAAGGVNSFPQGGYTIVRGKAGGRDLHLIMDHGPLGYLSIAAHGHADANAIVLSIDGQPILVDPGTYLYHSGGAWRDWFRGTRAHNTLTIGGIDQSEIAGPFNWSKHARARLTSIEQGVNWSMGASHDGYVRRFGVAHHRRIVARDGGFEVRDALIGLRIDLKVEAVFQFAPDLDVVASGARHRASRNGVPILDVAFSAPGDVRVASGGVLGTGGWVSPRFGEKQPAARLSWTGRMPPEGLTTRIMLLPLA